MFKRLLGLIPFVVLIVACGSGGDDHTPTAGSGSTGGSGGSGTAPDDPIYSLGSGTGSAFQAGTIGASSTSLAAGASATLSVSIVDQTGVLFTSPTSVSFSSACIGQNLASVTTPVETSTGVATTTYVAKGCNGTDVVTASATAESQSLVASVSLNIAPAAVGSLEFVSATPTNIALKGASGLGRPEASTVIFRVVDAAGGARPNANVTFSLDSNVGGINLSSTSATSDANGRVQTVVNAGTVATTVRVTARIASPAISNQSSQLSVTTGVPDSDSFSIAPVCANVEAFGVDGVVAPITARLADRFNNPVPDGTAITFTAEGGQIVSQCTTATTATGAGVCTANWTSSNPRPLTPVNGVGRVTVLASAIGEDSFTDSNANGFFDATEAFADLGEPFRDDDESDTYNSGEFFLDFNNDGVRQATDGTFSGVRCTGTAATDTCNLTTTAIGARTLIVMSTSGAIITGPTDETVVAGTAEPLTYNVKDLNGNAMPAGTTISATASSGAGTIEGTASFTVPCDAGRSGQTVQFFLKPPATNVGGVMTITVTSPAGLVTIFTTSIHI